MDNAIHTFENHAQDSRIQDIGDVSPLLGASNANSAGVSGNNPLVVFSKASHARNAAGDGERYEKSEVAQTRNTFDQGETRAQEVVVSGCLNPGDPMTLRVYGEDGANPTLQNGGTGGTIRQGVLVTPEICKTLSAEGCGGMPDIQKGNGQPVVAVRTANTHANGHGFAEEATHTLDRASGQAVAVGIDPYNAAQTGSAAATLGVNAGMPTGRNAVAVGFKAGQSANGGIGAEEEVCPTQSHQPSALEPTVALNHIVRRLTPTEAERLQGFPDGWTRIPYRGRPADECPDSPRYKALGNSWATNCAEWILRRIVAAFRLDMIPEVSP